MTRPIVHRIHTRHGWEWTPIPPPRSWISRALAGLACMSIGAGLTVAFVVAWGG